MKNAMKKLMSLVLVAILLVSAVPFAASAASVTKVVIKKDGAVIHENANVAISDAGNTVQELLNASGFDMTGYAVSGNPYIYYAEGKGEATMDTKMVPGDRGVHIAIEATTPPTETQAPAETQAPVVRKDIAWELKYAESGEVVKSGSFTPKDELANAKDILYYHVFDRSNDWQANYTCTKVWSHLYQTNVGYEGQVPEGDTVSFVLTNKKVQEEPKPTEPEATTPANKFPWDIYLNIYVNNKVDVPAKTIKINDTIALDNTVSLSETLTIVDDYYYATDSNKGIILDGLYMGKGNWALNFVTDSGKYDTFINLDQARQENYVFINVMATNVTARGTYTADSSNPKTGDTIFAPIFVLGLSASALAVMFYLNKKRAF
ncbi:MAG: hypothetical protein IKA16_00165 [Oscillospiraceae bacterium]|nr:hypothetical protein [Oscillospiraceae bacterium]